LEARPVIIGDWTSQRGFEMGESLIGGQMPTAIFSSNDPMALGAIYALTEAGYAVPEDVSVVGFDDVPGAAYFRPPLTTLRQNFEALGRQCIEALLAAIENNGAPQPPPIKPELIVRKST